MKHVRLLIFDWDGTLMDSANHIVSSIHSASLDMGLVPREDHEMRNIIGLGMKESVYALYPDEYTDEFALKFASLYRDYFFAEDASQNLFPGTIDTLEELIDMGYMLAVATGKSRNGLNIALKETGMKRLFTESRCADETRSKPHPQMIREILVSLDVNPKQAIMIGDTEYDLEMARNAGVHPVGVSYGVHEISRLQEYNPMHILGAIVELPNWLKEAE